MGAPVSGRTDEIVTTPDEWWPQRGVQEIKAAPEHTEMSKVLSGRILPPPKHYMNLKLLRYGEFTQMSLCMEIKPGNQRREGKEKTKMKGTEQNSTYEQQRV